MKKHFSFALILWFVAFLAMGVDRSNECSRYLFESSENVEIQAQLQLLIVKSIETALVDPDVRRLLEDFTLQGFGGSQRSLSSSRAQVFADIFQKLKTMDRKGHFEAQIRKEIELQWKLLSYEKQARKKILEDVDAQNDDIVFAEEKLGEIIRDEFGNLFRVDHSSLIMWGLQSSFQMTWEEAKIYCENINDRGLKWSLPSKENYLKAFYPRNQDSALHNARFSKIFNLSTWLWTADPDTRETAWAFGPHSIRNYFTEVKHYVRCVGR